MVLCTPNERQCRSASPYSMGQRGRSRSEPGNSLSSLNTWIANPVDDRLVGVELGWSRHAAPGPRHAQIAIELPRLEQAVDRPPADAGLAGHRRLRQALVKQMAQQYQALPSVHGRLPAAGRRNLGQDAEPRVPGPGLPTECAISVGDSVQSQTGDDTTREVELPRRHEY